MFYKGENKYFGGTEENNKREFVPPNTNKL
jgi:hypothetical protein